MTTRIEINNVNAPNITTFTSIFVEELYVGGILFDKDSFKGVSGITPTIDATAETGSPGKNWDLDYDFKLITSPAAGASSVYILPNPLALDLRYPIANSNPVAYESYAKTMIFLLPSAIWNTGSTVSVLDHTNRFMGKFYSQTQNMKFMNALGVWTLC